MLHRHYILMHLTNERKTNETHGSSKSFSSSWRRYNPASLTAKMRQGMKKKRHQPMLNQNPFCMHKEFMVSSQIKLPNLLSWNSKAPCLQRVLAWVGFKCLAYEVQITSVIWEARSECAVPDKNMQKVRNKGLFNQMTLDNVHIFAEFPPR